MGSKIDIRMVMMVMMTDDESLPPTGEKPITSLHLPKRTCMKPHICDSYASLVAAALARQ
jgi:hypothetical protein